MSKSLDTQITGFCHNLEEVKEEKKPEAGKTVIKEHNTGVISGKCVGKEGRQMGRVMFSIAQNKGEGSLSILFLNLIQ